MSDPATGQLLKRRDARSYWVLGDRMTFNLPARVTGGRFALAELVTPPRGGPPPHLHRNEDEVFYTLDGDFDFLSDGMVYPVPRGEVIFAPRDNIHQYRNKGAAPGTLLCWAQPARFEQFITELATPAEGVAVAPAVDQAAIERLNRLCPEYGIEMRPDAAETGRASLPARTRYRIFGTEVKVLCTGEQSGGSLCVFEITAPPGGGPPPHLHQTQEEIVYVLDGTVEFLIGSRAVSAERGDVVYLPKAVVHSFKGPARLLAFHAPAGIEHFFAECSSDAPAITQTPAELAAMGRKHDVILHQPPTSG